MKQSSSNSLLNISPIDGRYKNEVSELSNFYSEYAYLKYRVFIEVEFLLSLSDLKIIRKFKTDEKKYLTKLSENFSVIEGEKIKKIEVKTKHDVKAIEYYLVNKLNKSSLKDVTEFIHFGLTSEDINNIAIRLMLKESQNKVLLPNIKELNKKTISNSKVFKNIKMLARTHGQPAVPTTLGKEFLVFSKRLEKEIKYLEKAKFYGKINGAVGNYNALHFVYPKINWKKFSKDFLSKFELEANLTTTQVAPYEDIIFNFQTIQRINGIVLDLDQDMWRYISDNYFIQKIEKGEVGSSTMPQKVNPIDFENSEGNIFLANSLIDGYTNKLSTSRLQRDLSGSTISRNFGVTLSHSLLAYKNTLNGLNNIIPNKEKIATDLNADWSILTEAVQTYLKKEGIKEGFEIIKKQTRGRRLNKEDYQKLINNLPLGIKQKNYLLKLNPENYLG